ncbi:uncharacterized protein METZ01_LOCUS370874 [marine metagenome]|uniref:Uncharacterized protein n=1 Tax=marine metagenome TaxID=408172 RepID=A0A382T798_9ZZZZ
MTFLSYSKKEKGFYTGCCKQLAPSLQRIFRHKAVRTLTIYTEIGLIFSCFPCGILRQQA